MQARISIIVFLSVIILVSSCEKEEVSEFTDTPIIESYLQPGDYLNIKVSRQIPFSSEVSYSSDDIDNLNVQVTINDITHTLQPLGNGNYIDSSLIVSENDNYNLSFQFNSKNVTAYTYVPGKPTNVTQSATQITIERIDTSSGFPSGGLTMPDPIEITWSNPDNSYYLIVVENIEATLDPIRDFGDNAPPGNFFRKQPSNNSSEEIRSMEFQYYGTHRIIIYHVLPDYAALYNQSSTSSQNLSNPSTSITNGYGIFTGLNSDTLIIDVKKP
ncbi:MAG: hypothetical protein A2033_05585 [Bacteroidetes bacterium GWA2_31_9]|nr:MAG: hypothetical protein A2033_05585 [Bacteroidetes bacterium GWA2_31_9]